MPFIRKATEKDLPLILKFIKGIAEYEKLGNTVKATPELLKEWLFSKHVAEVLFVVEKNIEVGYLIYFYNFSTFEGKGGIYIEDIFILPEFRGKGLGKLLMNHIREIAEKENLGRIEWTCLNWNSQAIRFYKSLGATPMEDWTNFRLTL